MDCLKQRIYTHAFHGALKTAITLILTISWTVSKQRTHAHKIHGLIWDNWKDSFTYLMDFWKWRLRAYSHTFTHSDCSQNRERSHGLFKTVKVRTQAFKIQECNHICMLWIVKAQVEVTTSRHICGTRCRDDICFCSLWLITMIVKLNKV